MTDDSTDILADIMAAAEEAAEAAARGDAGERPRTWQARNLAYNRFGGRPAFPKVGTAGASPPARVVSPNLEPPSLPFPPHPDASTAEPVEASAVEGACPDASSAELVEASAVEGPPPAIVLAEDVGDYSQQTFEGLALGEPPGTPGWNPSDYSAEPATMVELGRTSERSNSSPALHQVVTDPSRGPYYYHLELLNRRSTWKIRNWERDQISRKAWKSSDDGKVSRKASRKVWKNSENGIASEKSRRRRKSIDDYLNRPVIAIDSEGRCPLHCLDEQGRSPLEVLAAGGLDASTADASTGSAVEASAVEGSKWIVADAGGFWEPHQLNLIGAAAIDRPYGTPIGEAQEKAPYWLEASRERGLSTAECFDFLLSLPEKYAPSDPVFVMFSAMYDWTMWLFDLPFGKASELCRKREFKPPCRRMRGYVFWRQFALQMLPHHRFDLGELRWPDDPKGLRHQNDPDYDPPAKGRSSKLQFKRSIRIYDIFRWSPKSFLKTIEPLAKRGLISQADFKIIEENKAGRGSFHARNIEDIKEYTSKELYSTCKLMYMFRDAAWTSMSIRLKSFHSPANAAGELLKRIGIRNTFDRNGNLVRAGHSWPVKSDNLDYEQTIAHYAYFGGRFETNWKGTFHSLSNQYDLASAYPYAMQSLPSMLGGRWERVELKRRPDLFKRIEQCCILSIFKVKFDFAVAAPFYPLPYRIPGSPRILYPEIGYGYYMRDDLLVAADFCRKYKVDPAFALIVEEANWFIPSEQAEADVREGKGPFAPIAEAFMKRIEFDKRDPGGPEQGAIKNAVNSVYGKLAERIFRGLSPDGTPIIPPYCSPWYAAAITAHTRRELMKAALLKPAHILQSATDAIYSKSELKLSRLKEEADIRDGKVDKLLGDWCRSPVPKGVFVQSGLAFYFDKDDKVVEVKCRGLPLKRLDLAQAAYEEIKRQWEKPYDPSAPPRFDKRGKTNARHVSVPLHLFMPITSAVVSPNRYKKLRGMWGDATKTIWLDDPGAKRVLGEPEFMDELNISLAATLPAPNPHPRELSQLVYPAWVADEVQEALRQKAAVARYGRVMAGKEPEGELAEADKDDWACPELAEDDWACPELVEAEGSQNEDAELFEINEVIEA